MKSYAATHKTPHVAVAGGGIAGLTAAYRLARQGADVTVYEATPRVGGKIRSTKKMAGDRPFDFGAEFIGSMDSGTKKLCKELHVPLEATNTEPAGEKLCYVSGSFHTQDEMAGLFADFASRMEEIKCDLKENGEWTEYAHMLDNMPLEKFFQQLENVGVDPRVTAIFRKGYTSEIGNEPMQLSALNFIDCFHADNQHMEIFSTCDEGNRVTGGMQTLTDAIHKACRKLGVKFRMEQKVTSLDPEDGGVRVHTEEGGSSDKHYDHVVLATSLPMLKEIKGLSEVGIPQEQIDFYAALGHTNTLKIGLTTKGAPWNAIKDSNGMFLTDGCIQCSWVVSHPTTKDERGTIGMLIGGVELPPKGSEKEEAAVTRYIEQVKEAYAEMLGKKPSEVFDDTRKPKITISRSNVNGCYVSPRPGQYIPLMQMGEKIPDGPVSLIGGHVPFTTEHGTKIGFMECAVRSAEKEAERIAEKLALTKEKKKVKAHSRINPASDHEMALV